MKSKICFFHTGFTQRRLKDALAHLRSEGFTTRDQHDFIINYICKCNKEDSNSSHCCQSNNDDNGKYLDYLINLNNDNQQNDKTKILLKIRNLLLEIYEVVEDVETKRRDFLVLVKYLQISTLFNDFSTILNNFMDVEINFDSQNGYSRVFDLPMSSQDYHAFSGVLANIRYIESTFKCHIRAKNDQTHTQVTISSNRLVDFKKIKDSILEKLEQSHLMQSSIVFKVKPRARLCFSKPSFHALFLNQYDCKIQLIHTNMLKLWGKSKDLEGMKSIILSLIDEFEDEHEVHECLDDLIDQRAATYSKRYIEKLNNKNKFIQHLFKLKLNYSNL